MKTATAKTQKTVTVLNVYKFKSPINRICFEVLSSDETTKYNTCFNGDAEHGSCNCDGHEQYHKDCYHIKGLRPRAQAYFDSRQPSDEQDETPGLDAAEKYLSELKAQPYAPFDDENERRDAWKETAQFTPSHKFERAPSGKLVPMR